MQQQLVQQDADGQRRLNLDREKVLDRLWEIANLSPEMTRGSITGQVKALTIIVAMQNFIPDRRAASSEKKSPLASTQPQIDASVGRSRQQATTPATTNDPQPSPAPPVPACRGAQQADGPDVLESKFAPGSVAEAPPAPGTSQSTFASRSTPSEAPVPYVSLFTSVPDLGVDFSTKKTPLNPFVRPR